MASPLIAATPSVTQSWLQPLAAHHNNLSATIAVIELCQALNIPKLVFASSAAVYGKQTLPICEADTTNPISPYGLQKLVSEQYGRLFAQKLGFSFVGLRLFNVFGSRQVPNSQYSGVISLFVTAMRQSLPITIYGDGSQTRDFIFVKDVATAFAKALTTPVNRSYFVCNIGTGNSISLTQLVDIIKECLPEWKSEIIFAPPRSGDIQHSQADTSKAFSLLDFTPLWSMQSGINHLIKSL